MRKRQAEVRESWRQMIAEQEKSGRSVRAFCRERGVGEHSFYQWRRRLRQSEAPVTFALVETQRSAQPARIELVLASGELLRIPPEAASLRLVLEVLRQQA
jgi:transposase-like protein